MQHFPHKRALGDGSEKKTAFIRKKPQADPDSMVGGDRVDRDHKLFRKLFTEVVNQLGSRVIFS